jgi:hypothetical protein
MKKKLWNICSIYLLKLTILLFVMFFLIGSKDTTLAAETIADVTYKIGAPKEMIYVHFYLQIDRNTPIWSYSFYTRYDERDKPVLIESGRIDSSEKLHEVIGEFNRFSLTAYKGMVTGLLDSDYLKKNRHFR